MALVLALLRDIPRADAAVKRGEWMGVRLPRPMVSGRRLGILGLGEIGLLIAARAQGGFAMEVAYHNRRPREGCAHPWMESVPALATWADLLLIAAPGGAATRHLVDGAALEALGPSGYLVNIGRGSVVDQAALIAALREGRIAGAAIDVVDGEPEVPQAMRDLPNLIITPHIAGRSPEAVLATATLLVANLQAHFAGRPVLTPVR
jgi:lactate dehydrogenase-like 2-hydroxyacid dehydrogenase